MKQRTECFGWAEEEDSESYTPCFKTIAEALEDARGELGTGRDVWILKMRPATKWDDFIPDTDWENHYVAMEGEKAERMTT